MCHIFFWNEALQEKAMLNNREWLTQEGFALNSKWNEAEKYICNPLSGEVPMECLSSRTLSSRSFRNLATTMSAPLHYPNPNPLTNIGQNKPNNDANVRVIHEDLYVPDPVLVRGDLALNMSLFVVFLKFFSIIKRNIWGVFSRKESYGTETRRGYTEYVGGA